MSYESMQIFDIKDVAERANLAKNSKRINVYSGHLTATGRGVLLFSIQRGADGEWPQNEIDYLTKLRGKNTVCFMPQREYMYVESGINIDPGQSYQIPYYYGAPGHSEPMPGAEYQNKSQLELIRTIIDLERKNEKLTEEVEELTEELKQFETHSGKFAHSLENLFFQIAPKLGINLSAFEQPNNTEPMQGTQDWQKIDLSGNTEPHIENALIVLLEAFGAEFVLKFARTIQADPNKVNTLKSFL